MWAYLPERAIILCRISDADADELGGVDRQERTGRGHAEQIGWGVLRVVIENDVSAYKRRKIMLPNGRRALRVIRPAYRQALDDLMDGVADGLLAIDLDRVTRDPRDLEDLIEVIEMSNPRIPVTSVTGSLRLDTDADIAMARVMVAMANKSSRDTARRVSDARREQAEQGRYGGGSRRCFGFEPDGETIREAEAAEIRRSVLNLLADDDTTASLRQEVKSLVRRGVETVTGADWTQTAWRQIILRPRNAGILVHKGEETGRLEGTPILDEDVWRAAVALLTDPDRTTTYGGPVPSRLGSGEYLCGVCDGTVTGRPGRVRKEGKRIGVRRATYLCPQGHVSRSEEDVDEAVVTVVTARLAKADAVSLLQQAPTVDKIAVLARIKASEAKLDELVDAFDNDEITRAQLRRGTEKVKARLAQDRAQLRSTTNRDPLDGIAGNPDARKFWDGLDDLGRKRSIIKTLVRVRIMPARPGRRRAGSDPLDPDNLRVQIDWVR